MTKFSRRAVALGAMSGFGLKLTPSFARVSFFPSSIEERLLAEDWDVIVIGTGAAGLAAAVSAAERGVKVLAIEKLAEIGGNSRISGGYFACVDPQRQAKLGIADSEELFLKQLLKSGGGEADPELCRTLVYGASEALHWLESHGMRFQDNIIELYGAHWPRVHKPLMPMGEGYIQALSGAFLRHGGVLQTDVEAQQLVMENGRVSGVKVRLKATHEHKILKLSARRGVVIASGGFGANRDLVRRFAPELAGLTTNNSPGSTGEMLLAAQKIGAMLDGMHFIQCMPGCPPGRKYRVRLHNDVARFILINQEGRRFIREDARRDVIRDAVLALPERFAYSLTDDEGLRSNNIIFQKEAIIGVETGDAWRGDTLEELAHAMGIDAQTLEATVTAYNNAVEKGFDSLGKSRAELKHFIRTPPFWACYAGMTIHYTMGGIRINSKAQVLTSRGVPIPGLWCAGEASGGIHGVNRMGANGLNDDVVFGRIAGAGAATS